MTVLPVNVQDTVTVTLVLPETTLLRPSGAHTLVPCRVTIHVPSRESGTLSNAIELLRTLYVHGVTTPAELAFLMQLTGRRAVTEQDQSLNVSPVQRSPACSDLQE